MIIFYFILAGIFAGILGGMGMGGGTLLIPILTIFLKVPQHIAQGINLLSFIPMSIFALIIHIKHSYIEKMYIKAIAPTACVVSILGAYFAGLVDGAVLSKIFGGFLVALAVFQIIIIIRQAVKKKAEKIKLRND